MRGIMNAVFLTCCIVSSINANASEDGNVLARASVMYVTGEARDFEISYPRPGLIGSPSSTRSYPDIGLPKDEKDYEKRIVRVVVSAVHQEPTSVKVTLKLEEIDSQGEPVREKAVYIAYVFVNIEGTGVVFRSGHSPDSPVSRLGSLICYDIPFPFTCACPPSLSLKDRAKSGFYLSGLGHGVEFEKVATDKEPKGTVKVDAKVFVRKSPRVLLNKEQIESYDPVTASLSNNTLHKVLYRETQTWKHADDWIWTSMERCDDEGHVQLRCKQIEIKDKQKPELK